MKKDQRLEKDGATGRYVVFYGSSDELGALSNFSDHSVTLPNPWTGKHTTYLTGEHRFQAMKATNARDHDWVSGSSSPYHAKRAGRVITLRSGWGNDVNCICWFVMCEIVMAKLCQNSDVFELLAGIRGFIYEDSPIDPIWGWRMYANYSGRNLLGKAWMQARFLRLGY